MANNYKVKTPHAAILIWNYKDRIGTEGFTNNPQSTGVKFLTDVDETIISTLSCISIQTSKSKGQPEGTFQLVLAPTKDWVSTITPGSWMCILMSNNPITEQDLKKADKDQVKMIGKIESVRAEVNVTDDGARQTRYYVAGVDWAHIFNNVLYVDNLIAGPNDPISQGNQIAVALRNLLFAQGGTPQSFDVKDNLRSLINMFGNTIDGLDDAGHDINRLAGSLYNFVMPKEMVQFFDFQAPSGNVTRDQRLNKILNLQTGSLKDEDDYTDSRESKGFIDPFTLQGQHTFWQVLMDNSNPVLNEMYAEMRWPSNNDDTTNNLRLTIFNRIKPFSYKGFNPDAGSGSGFKSYFQNCKVHDIDKYEVEAVNAGTNWRDKFNFIEVKPNFQDFSVLGNWYSQKNQAFDPEAFKREGFRPLIMETKQFPSKGDSAGSNSEPNIDFDQLQKWVFMMREWYFDTHRMLNGTIQIHGSTEYIAVGDNIRFDASLLNVTPNINKAVADAQTTDNFFILGHVENVSNTFTVNEGARAFTTTIQFVRGIVVNGDNKVAGEGPLDKYADQVKVNHRDRNTVNTASTSDQLDPDSHKLKGT